MDSDAATVDQYIDRLDDQRRAALTVIRSLILETLPEARETMRHRMPTFEIGDVICSLASQKQYISLYMDSSLVAKYHQELAHLKPGKSCIRFRRLEQLPLETVRAILLETAAAQDAAA